MNTKNKTSICRYCEIDQYEQGHRCPFGCPGRPPIPTKEQMRKFLDEYEVKLKEDKKKKRKK